ncbi:MAG: glycine betaine ABC transporter substrate-binding protein [Anaerovoracaceae bacterium]
MIKDTLAILVDRKGFFLELLWEHIEISFVVILISIIIGGIAGILISEYQRAAKPTMGVINFLYTIPSISMLGFLIPFSGIGNSTAIIALTIYALLPMVRNTHTGITNVDPIILEAAKGMGSTKFQILYKIKIPLAMPMIIAGIRNMVIMTIALAGIASFIGAGGLGVAIYRGITTNNSAMTIGGSLLIALLALVTDQLLGFMENRMKLRSKKAKRTNKVMAGIAVVTAVIIIGVSILGGTTGGTIHIATKPMTEQYIIGEMLTTLIEEDTNLKVKLTQGVGGGTSNIEPAMEKGEFDMYPEYTGTGWNMVLKEKGIYRESEFPKLQAKYAESLNMEWIGMYGFNNTFGLVVRSEIADKYNLKTYSDLAKASRNLTLGAEYDFFEREDGYKALSQTYGMNFKNTRDMDIGLKYKALEEGKIDAMVMFTTDGMLAEADAVVLKDDKKFYPSYMAGNVIRKDVLEKHPELKGVFDKLTNIITDRKMSEMNYMVEKKGQLPKKVADDFLKEVGLLK